MLFAKALAMPLTAMATHTVHAMTAMAKLLVRQGSSSGQRPSKRADTCGRVFIFVFRQALAKLLVARAAAVPSGAGKVCLLGGGETTCVVTG